MHKSYTLQQQINNWGGRIESISHQNKQTASAIYLSFINDMLFFLVYIDFVQNQMSNKLFLDTGSPRRRNV